MGIYPGLSPTTPSTLCRFISFTRESIDGAVNSSRRICQRAEALSRKFLLPPPAPPPRTSLGDGPLPSLYSTDALGSWIRSYAFFSQRPFFYSFHSMVSFYTYFCACWLEILSFLSFVFFLLRPVNIYNPARPIMPWQCLGPEPTSRTRGRETMDRKGIHQGINGYMYAVGFVL